MTYPDSTPTHQDIADTGFASLTDRDSITVLHVEDDADFGELSSTLLERVDDDITVRTVSNADDALDRLAGEEMVDCIVSDYQMPGTDGIEFLEAVRERYPDLPFILFTGKGSEEIASEAISTGVTDYLQKDGGADQFTVLANRVRNAVRKHRAERTTRWVVSALETAREGISLLDEDGHFLFVNQAYADIYGYDQSELLGEHWKRIYPDAEYRRMADDVLPEVRDAGNWTGETTHVRADGTEIVTDHALAYTADGLLICTVREHSDAAGATSGLSPRTLDALDDLLFVFDEEGTLQYWNQAVADVTGYTGSELASMSPTEFVEPDDRERMERYVREATETGEARAEARLLTESGETIPYEFISKAVTDEDGEPVGRIGLGRDISTRKEYERQVEEQTDRLQHFAEVLSHDLRNPLSVALANLELYARKGDEQYYETARKGLDRMDDMIDDVLSLARESGSVDSDEYEAVELRECAASAWALVDDDSVTLDVVDSATLDVDASRLQQVLENLFRNVLEHCDGDVTIRVGTLDDGFYVEDDGPGIPEERRDEVFDAGHSTKDGGTGFGLTSVEQIADAHGWDVTVTEGTDGGARFEFTGVERAD